MRVLAVSCGSRVRCLPPEPDTPASPPLWSPDRANLTGTSSSRPRSAPARRSRVVGRTRWRTSWSAEMGLPGSVVVVSMVTSWSLQGAVDTWRESAESSGNESRYETSAVAQAVCLAGAVRCCRRQRGLDSWLRLVVCRALWWFTRARTIVQKVGYDGRNRAVDLLDLVPASSISRATPYAVDNEKRSTRISHSIRSHSRWPSASRASSMSNCFEVRVAIWWFCNRSAVVH